MLKFEIVTENELDKYNQIIAVSPNSSIYQAWQWGNIRAQESWAPYRFFIFSDMGLVGGCQILVKNIFGYKILYLPRGPVIDYSQYSIEGVITALIKFVRQFPVFRKTLFVKFNPDVTKRSFDNSWLSINNIFKSQHPIIHTATFRIDLSKTDEELYNAFESRTRYDIKKAAQKGVEVVFIDNKDDCLFQVFYSLFQEVAKKNDFPIYSFDLMYYIWKLLGNNRMCQVVLSRYKNTYLSGAFLLCFGGKVLYQWGGAIRGEVNPNQLMHWEIIKWAKSNGYFIYDLQGVPEKIKKGDPLWGIYLFKRGFGGNYIKLIGEYDWVDRPLVYKIWTYFEPHYPNLKNSLKKWLGK